MINRDDMLELTRRMTVNRCCFQRIAGAYMDAGGYVDGTFNTNFLKLSASEKQRNLEIAKAIPFSNTNVNLKEYKFTKAKEVPGSMWKLLQGIKSCGLKNDALMETFYEIVADLYQTNQDYAIYVFYAVYDVPVRTGAKASDRGWDEESEEVYEFLISAICPLAQEYTPADPECGFIYPLFCDRSGDEHQIGIFNQDADNPHDELLQLLLEIKEN